MNTPAKIVPNVARMQAGRSASGTPSFNCGDVVAQALQGLTADQIIAIADKVGLDTSKYEGMNNGHKRMVIGGALRKRVRNQDKLHEQKPEYIETGEQWLKDIVASL